MDIQLKRGILEICVLAAMLHEDSYGYQLIRDVSPHIAISESTLYPILKRLEAANLVSVYSTEHNGRLRKYYAISAAGRERISDFLAEWNNIMDVYNYIREAYQNDKRTIPQ